jgi:ribonuclease HII
VARWSTIERDLRDEGYRYIAGVDEVGRGPLAGPVVVCAVLMPPDQRAIPGVADSKQLSAAVRNRLAPIIRARALAYSIAAASVSEIERYNILGATALAIRRAATRLRHPYDLLLIDGKPIRQLGLDHRAVVDADARCYSVACASILAKVVRDHLLERLARRYPVYAWERNAGYGTPAHLAGLRIHGQTAHHRSAFCKSALEPRTADHKRS